MDPQTRKLPSPASSSEEKSPKPRENTWQDRMMGSPALLISILFHALLIGGVVMLYQHYRAIALQEAAEAAKIIPDPVEYPIKMDPKKKTEPAKDDPEAPFPTPPKPSIP